MQQKLVSIRLETGGKAPPMESHLDDYLEAGWRVDSITRIGAAGGGALFFGVGWALVLLVKE
jgi:hypothetical protein